MAYEPHKTGDKLMASARKILTGAGFDVHHLVIVYDGNVKGDESTCVVATHAEPAQHPTCIAALALDIIRDVKPDLNGRGLIVRFPTDEAGPVHVSEVDLGDLPARDPLASMDASQKL